MELSFSGSSSARVARSLRVCWRTRLNLWQECLHRCATCKTPSRVRTHASLHRCMQTCERSAHNFTSLCEFHHACVHLSSQEAVNLIFRTCAVAVASLLASLRQSNQADALVGLWCVGRLARSSSGRKVGFNRVRIRACMLAHEYIQTHSHTNNTSSRHSKKLRPSSCCAVGQNRIILPTRERPTKPNTCWQHKACCWWRLSTPIPRTLANSTCWCECVATSAPVHASDRGIVTEPNRPLLLAQAAVSLEYQHSCADCGS